MIAHDGVDTPATAGRAGGVVQQNLGNMSETALRILLLWTTLTKPVQTEKRVTKSLRRLWRRKMNFLSITASDLRTTHVVVTSVMPSATRPFALYSSMPYHAKLL